MADPYFEIDRVSNSSLGWMLKSPAYYKFRQDVIFEAKSPALIFGSLVHCLVLEPENFDRDFWTLNPDERPEKAKGMTSTINKDWKALKDAQNSDKQIILLNDLGHAERVARSVEIEAGELLRAKDNEFEKTVLWEKDGVKMKSKQDIVNPMFLADLKTAQSSNPYEWQRKAFWEYKYYRQGAVYLDGDAGGIYTGEKDFYFIVVEKSAPYLVSVHRLGSGLIAKGLAQYRELLKKLKWCQKNDKWPHFEKDYYDWDE